MGTSETFDHTADVGLRVWGNSLDDVFQTAAEGLFDLIVANRKDIRLDEVEKVSMHAESVGELLAAWLGELIFRSEIQHVVFGAFEVRVDEEMVRLDATLRGERIDPERHVLDHEVKAVTRHGLALEREGDGWKAELILDI